MGNISTSRRMRTWRILAHVITGDFWCFSQRARYGVHSTCSHRCVVRCCGHMRCPCVYCFFLSGRSGIVFNPSVGAITDHSQSAKVIDQYYKSQLYEEDPGHRKPVLILPHGLSKPGERAHDRSLISAVGGIRTHNPLNDNQTCYHWAITALWW